MSNARDDLPEPDSPVITTSLFLGISTSIFFRLLTRAPLISMELFFIIISHYSEYQFAKIITAVQICIMIGRLRFVILLNSC